MGTRANPGKYDCHAAAQPDEPIFVLLARDPAAPAAIEDWADLRAKMVRHGDRPETDWDMIGEARIVAQEMREWRRDNRAVSGAPVSEVEPPRREDAKDEEIGCLKADLAAMVNVGLAAYAALEWFTKFNAQSIRQGDAFLNNGGYATAVTLESNLRSTLNGASEKLSRKPPPAMPHGASAVEVEPPRREDAKVRTCRACGCTDDHACEGGCWWVGDDICSACAEWPAEPWVTSDGPEDRGCIFQEGEVDAIAVVDVNRENPDDYVHMTAKRIAACVKAMAGIEDPEAFVERQRNARHVALLTRCRAMVAKELEVLVSGYRVPGSGETDEEIIASTEFEDPTDAPMFDLMRSWQQLIADIDATLASLRLGGSPVQETDEPDNSGVDDYIARPPVNFEREE
jgi:hypothetical protein